MPDLTHFALYLAAAFMLAVTPGPGIFYIATRTLSGGRGLQLRDRPWRLSPCLRRQPGRFRDRAGKRGAVHRAEAGRCGLSYLDGHSYDPVSSSERGCTYVRAEAGM